MIRSELLSRATAATAIAMLFKPNFIRRADSDKTVQCETMKP